MYSSPGASSANSSFDSTRRSSGTRKNLCMSSEIRSHNSTELTASNPLSLIQRSSRHSLHPSTSMDIDTYAHGRAELSDSPTAGVSGIAIRPSSPAVRDAPANTQSSASALEAVFANLAIDGNSREDHTAPPELEHRAPRVQDALAYLDAIKKEFKDSPGVYNQFLEIMRAFKNEAFVFISVQL
jgi:histone deacetylase complex regulatory component SIN3